MTPKLRFSEFKGNWSVSTLREVTDKITDGTHHSPQLLEKGLYKYISSKNIRNGKMLLDNVPYVSEKDHEGIYSRCDVQLNDVLLTKDGASTGNVCLNELKEPFSMLSSVALIRANSDVISNDFIYQFLLSPQGQKEVRAAISGQAITRITLTKLKKFRIPYPSKKSEQAKLCYFLAAIDRKINLLTKKKEALETYKKGLMQKIFSQELRFKREDGTDYPEWTNSRLQELLAIPITDGPHSTPKFIKNGIPFLSVNNIVNNRINFDDVRNISFEDHLIFSKKCKPLKNDILLGKAATVGCVALVETENEFNIWSPLALIRITSTNSSKYFYYAFQSEDVRRQIKQKINSSSQANIGMKDIIKLRFNFPKDINEQDKICKLLSNVDNQIESIGQKLNKVNDSKKGLLQQMFV